MKLNKSLLYIAAMVFSLSACDDYQPWNEIEGTNGQKGKLVLDLAAKAPERTRADISTDGFYVKVVGKDEALKSYSKSFVYGADLTASTVLEMPVGNYTVSVSSFAVACPKQYIYPVYGATKDIKIESTTTTKTTINCKMVNSRISVNYSEDFLSKFTSWEITINDGGSRALTYKEDDTKPKDVYWLFEENTTTVTVDIKATTKEGVNVAAQATYTKRNSAEHYTDIDSEFFGGGDALEINFNPATNNFGTITGITITTNIQFTNTDQTVVVEVVDDGNTSNPGENPGGNTNPVDPPVGGDGIVINSIPADGQVSVAYGETSNYPTVQYDFTFPTGIKELNVTVSSTDDFFVAACADFNLDAGLDLSSQEAIDYNLGELFPLPVKGDKTYRFALEPGIWELLVNFAGTHTFTLKAVDMNGESKTEKLVVNIK